MNKEQEENVSGFTRDIKNFLRQEDFESSIILVVDLKKYIMKLRRNLKCKN